MHFIDTDFHTLTTKLAQLTTFILKDGNEGVKIF